MVAGRDEKAEQLIAELLGTGEMNADSTADLERMRADNDAGALDSDDHSYLEAFHQRIMASRQGQPIGSPELDAVETAATDAGAGAVAGGRIAELEAELAAALARAEAAEAELARLNADAPEAVPGDSPAKDEGGAP